MTWNQLQSYLASDDMREMGRKLSWPISKNNPSIHLEWPRKTTKNLSHGSCPSQDLNHYLPNTN